MERKLAAILAADVVGYSRLMAADEAGTLVRMKAHRRELWGPMTGCYGGRIVGTAGDSLLVEFGSAVAAVECGVAVQRGMAERNADLPEDQRMQLRVGVNIGEVIVDEDDIYGDGVNIAARLEALCEAGGVVISGNVHEHVNGKLAEHFADAGEHDVKNIARPVHLWRWSADGEPEIVVVDVSKPVAGFDGRPAIAVLPFENMSGDPEQEYFADGIAEDILTRLSMWRWLPVIARNSSFTYKGRAVDVKAAGRALGARYVLEGSVRKAGQSVRITGQLIDAESGHHLWADRFDGSLDDIFELQDTISERVVAALEVVIRKTERNRAIKQDPNDLGAWEACKRGCWYLNQYRREDWLTALEFLERATAMDPEFAYARSLIAFIYSFSVSFGWTENPTADLDQAKDHAIRARAADDMEPYAHVMLSYAEMYRLAHASAHQSATAALELNPSLPIAMHALGAVTMMSGDHAAGKDHFERALRLSPRDPHAHLWLGGIAASHYLAKRYDDAVVFAEQTLQAMPHYPIGHRTLAISLAQLGKSAEANEAIRRFRDLAPDSNLQNARNFLPLQDEADLQHYVDGLRKAGLPDITG